MPAHMHIYIHDGKCVTARRKFRCTHYLFIMRIGSQCVLNLVGPGEARRLDARTPITGRVKPITRFRIRSGPLLMCASVFSPLLTRFSVTDTYIPEIRGYQSRASCLSIPIVVPRRSQESTRRVSYPAVSFRRQSFRLCLYIE